MAVELPPDRLIASQVREEQMRGSHHCPNTFLVQPRQGYQRLGNGAGSVIYVGDQVAVEVNNRKALVGVGHAVV